jgi:hypothetical protein
VTRFADIGTPLFVFDRDGGLSLEWSNRFGLEAIDVANGEYPDAFTLDGERVVVAVQGDRNTGRIEFQRTGDRDPAALEARLRRQVERDDLLVVDTGDLAVDVANALAREVWESRWPKRPRWLSRLLHGDGPLPVSRPD